MRELSKAKRTSDDGRTGKRLAPPVEKLAMPLIVAAIITVLAPILPELPFTSPYTPRFIGLLISAAAWLWAWGLVPSQFRRIGRLQMAAAVVMVVTVASSLASFSPGMAFTFGAEGGLMGAPSWLALLVVFALSSMVTVQDGMRVLVKWAFIWGLPLAIMVLVQSVQGIRVNWGFGNNNYIVAILLLLLPLALFEASEGRNAQRWAWVGIATLVVVATLVAGALSGIVGLLVQLSLILVFAPTLLTLSRFRRVARVVGIVILCCVLLAGVLVGAHVAGMDVSGAGSLTERVLSETTVQTRLEMWGSAWRMFTDHPLLGVGPDGFQHASQAYLTMSALALEAGSYVDVRVLIRDPHSIAALAPSSLGPIGCRRALLACI